MLRPEAILFGEGCQTVNCEKMSKAVGASPTTLRRWKAGEFPPALKQFAAICRIRGLSNEDIGKIVRSFR